MKVSGAESAGGLEEREDGGGDDPLPFLYPTCYTLYGTVNLPATRSSIFQRLPLCKPM